jgi:hypothetical protein
MSTLIISLLSSSRPSTIVGRVSAFVVDAVERAISWSFTHIGDKVPKVVPAFANGNTAPSVIFVGLVFFVAAPIVHAEPRSICEIVSGMPVPRVVTLPFKTPTRTSITEPQISVSNTHPVAASASAKPINLSVFAMGNVESGQALKTLTGDVDVMNHNRG